MRALSALLLSLVLALASVSMAVARGQAPMGSSVTLCVEGSAVTVRLDAHGKPLPAAPHLCPDCLSAATAFALPGEIALPAPRSGSRLLARALAPSLLPSAPRLAARARGPPLVSA